MIFGTFVCLLLLAAPISPSCSGEQRASYLKFQDSGWSAPINISHNTRRVTAGYNGATLLALSSNGVHCFAAWTYTVETTSRIYFTSS